MLKYLFKVEYKDGTIFKQNKEDVSLKDPKRSAFFDIKQESIKRFSLIGEHIYTVDLIDGHFEVDGVFFKMHEGNLTDFRLIFFRRHTHTYPVKEHSMVYRIGWQTTVEGKNYQRVMEIE